MDLTAQVLRRLERRRPFRVAVPPNDLTELLSSLAARWPSLPEIVVRRANADGSDVLLDFSGVDTSWALRADAHGGELGDTAA